MQLAFYLSLLLNGMNAITLCESDHTKQDFLSISFVMIFFFPSFSLLPTHPVVFTSASSARTIEYL